MNEVAVPNGWCTATIMDVATSSGGGTPSKSDPTYWLDGTLPWVSPKDMKVFLVGDSEDKVTTKALDRLTLIPDKSVLVVVRSGILSRTLPVAISQCPVTINQDMRAFLPDASIDARYVAWHLVSKERDILDRCAKDGTTVASIEGAALAAYPLLIAPSAEQTRIVEKLEELLSDLDAGVAELKAAQRKLAQYRQSLLKAAVEGALTADWRAARTAAPSSSSLRKQGSSDSKRNTAKSLDSRVRGNDDHEETGADLLQRILTERRARWQQKQLAKFAEQGKTPPQGWQSKYPEPVAPDTADLPVLPDGWVWVVLDHLLVEGPQNGLYLPANRYGRGFPILRIDDFQSGWIRSKDELRLVEADEETLSVYALHEDDLVVNRVNSITHLGKSQIVRQGHEGILFESNMMRARLSRLIDAKFVGLYLTSEIGRARLIKDAKWAVNQASINQQDVKRTPVPLPGFSEQLEICGQVVAQLQEMASMQSATDVSLKQAAAQRKNILKAAFAGQLVPQDPRDEPASVLLERIRAGRVAAGAGQPRSRKARQTDG